MSPGRRSSGFALLTLATFLITGGGCATTPHATHPMTFRTPTEAVSRLRSLGYHNAESPEVAGGQIDMNTTFIDPRYGHLVGDYKKGALSVTVLRVSRTTPTMPAEPELYVYRSGSVQLIGSPSSSLQEHVASSERLSAAKAQFQAIITDDPR